MQSKVSGYLQSEMADVIKRGLIAPLLARTFAKNFSYITEINKAHILMLVRQGVISPGTACRLSEVAQEIEADGASTVVMDTAREDAYFNYEANFIRRAGAEVGGQAHTGRSRNDLNATIDRMKARDYYVSLVDGALDLRLALIEQADLHRETLMPAYTHLQPAQPATYGWFLLGVEQALQRDTARLYDTFPRLNLSPLGAAAVVGTSFPIDRDYSAELLGFDGVIVHAQDAVANRDAVFELLSGTVLLSLTVGRMAQDFYLMTTFEFGTLELPDHVAATSSIMPQKKNMAVLESLKGRPAQLIGALTTCLASQKAISFSHTQETSIDSSRWLWDGLSEFSSLLPVASMVVRDARPCAARMSELVHRNHSTATDLAEFLVMEAGLSFREAHHVVGRFVRLSMVTRGDAETDGPKLLDIAAQQVLGRALSIGRDSISAALDPVESLRRKSSAGAPSPANVAIMVDTARQKLAEDCQLHDALKNRLTGAQMRLRCQFAALSTPAI